MAVLGLKIEALEGVHYLKGSFDEHASFDGLLMLADAPLKLNLREVQFINSLGLHKLIHFAKAAGDRAIELYDCPPVFIEAVNVMPLVIGGQSRVSRIKSVYLPFHCPDDHERNVSVPLKSITIGRTIIMPTIDCPTCKMPMEPDLDSDPDEFFFFLTA